jgi:hypothetical protein
MTLILNELKSILWLPFLFSKKQSERESAHVVDILNLEIPVSMRI